jgi:hypothetical protein
MTPINAAEVIKIEHSRDGCAVVMICNTQVIIAVDGSGVVTLTREELLSLAAAIPSQSTAKGRSSDAAVPV